MREGVDFKGREWQERSLSSRMTDISGTHFGRLTALFPVTSGKQNKWLCRCDCGNEVVVAYNALTSNSTKSCGCLHRETVVNYFQECRLKYIGQQFGRLTAIQFVSAEKNDAVYKFECICGNVIETTLHSVKDGNTKSCGCLKRDHFNMYKTDIIGHKFGKLTVQSYAGVNVYGTSDFICLCDCGETVVVSRNSLITGHTKSCGCIRSVGENNIKNLLNQTNLKFKPQYVFADLISNAGGWLPYDFAIFDINGQVERLIEFDGMQHVKPYEYFGGEEKFLRLKENDFLKNQYALSHNIPLVRIPYLKRDTMTLNDLLGDQYLYRSL